MLTFPLPRPATGRTQASWNSRGYDYRSGTKILRSHMMLLGHEVRVTCLEGISGGVAGAARLIHKLPCKNCGLIADSRKECHLDVILEPATDGCIRKEVIFRDKIRSCILVRPCNILRLAPIVTVVVDQAQNQPNSCLFSLRDNEIQSLCQKLNLSIT